MDERSSSLKDTGLIPAIARVNINRFVFVDQFSYFTRFSLKFMLLRCRDLSTANLIINYMIEMNYPTSNAIQAKGFIKADN